MIRFPQIKISTGYAVTFHSKDTQGYYQFFHYHTTIEESSSKALQYMIKLDKKPSKYKISTNREINISILF